ncbi:MAG: hypothetical protein F6J90_28510 [Moorea sp. SIOASIH]|uniref:hypothetical protein n=1 Tax=Moorena sp. SIOASIH TaxID=2607817 RepID=UPI0013B67029|nr:hypothetical protein [Moorena sp. SIOASIH]NEO40066.1 hypothetical protein [Moorena sp. SIOASIH]
MSYQDIFENGIGFLLLSVIPTPDSLLPTPYSRLPTPDSLLPTPDSLLPTPYSLKSTNDKSLHSSYFGYWFNVNGKRNSRIVLVNF